MEIKRSNWQNDANSAKLPMMITGAGRRLGLSIASHWLAQGNRVIATYRTYNSAIELLQQNGAHCIQVDFLQQPSIDELIAVVKGEYSGLRALVHNASDWQSEESSLLPPAELMNEMWKVHVSAPYQMNMALWPLLQAGAELSQSASDIIHVTDFVAEKGSDKHIAYAASKAGLANLMLSFAKKLAPHIKVNAVAPSLLMFHDEDDEKYRQKALNKSLLRIEPGEQEGVAAVQYVLNSHYMTGRTIALDGGRHLVTP